MAGINTGKVVTGGLVAGVVFNLLDFANSTLLMASDFEAGLRRLGLDTAVMESMSALVTWVIVDLLFGILMVWSYAAMRPRFGPGPRTAVLAAVPAWGSTTLMMMGFCSLGIFEESLALKSAVAMAVIAVVASLAGARFYQED